MVMWCTGSLGRGYPEYATTVHLLLKIQIKIINIIFYFINSKNFKNMITNKLSHSSIEN